MIVKSYAFLFFVFITNVKGGNSIYTYNALIEGWLKLYEPAQCSDALTTCFADGGVLASPLNSQLRIAVSDHVSSGDESVSTLYSGVHDQFGGDFFTDEDKQRYECGSSDCIAWAHDNDTLRLLECNEKLPFVCLRKDPLPVVDRYCVHPEYKYEERSGSCYKFHLHGENWPVAETKCKEEGAYLAIINSHLEARVLRDLFDTIPTNEMDITSVHYDQAFVGIQDKDCDGSWKTVKGQTLADAGYDVWGTGQPSSPGSECCGSLFRHGVFNDAGCHLNMAFICETKPRIVKSLPELVKSIPSVDIRPAEINTHDMDNTSPAQVNTTPTEVNAVPAKVNAVPTEVETEPVIKFALAGTISNSKINMRSSLSDVLYGLVKN